MRIRKEDKVSPWKLTYHGFDPKGEGLREVMHALGNGSFVTRGAAPEVPAGGAHYPGTYLAGCYNALSTRVAGRDVWNEDLVNCPNWLSLTFRIEGGPWFSPSSKNFKLLSYYQELDLQRGILLRDLRFRDRKGRRTRVQMRRFVHMVNPKLGGMWYAITAENYSEKVAVRSMLDGGVKNYGVARYRQLSHHHLTVPFMKDCGEGTACLAARTNQSKIWIVEASRTRIYTRGHEVSGVGVRSVREKKEIGHEFTIQARKGRRIEIEKMAYVRSSTGESLGNLKNIAVGAVRRAARFDSLRRTHERAWRDLWDIFDVQVEGGVFYQKILRLHSFHILQTASRHNIDMDVAMPARGLHGEAYRGHIFWDQLFVMPFYIFREPAIARSLLIYRYRRLGAARRYAKANGYKGSMFPWQGSMKGNEDTQEVHLNPLSGKWDPDPSRIQRHVSFAIAYNFWRYWQATEDKDFLIRYGAETLLSIAQFAADLAVWDSKDGRYHTEALMGPDEFHEKLPGADHHGVRDNAYSNLMIAWVLARARETYALLPDANKRRLLKKLKIDQREIDRWGHISGKMNVIMNKEGIVAQFDGYFGLKELDWGYYRRKYGNIHRMDRILKAEGKSANDYKVAKQADVLMLFYLLPLAAAEKLYASLGCIMNRKILEKNYDYYVQRTSHGSTLSRLVHCHLAHMIGKLKESWKLYMDVLVSDLYDIQGGTTPEGIHAGVMAGSVHVVMRDFAGVSVLDDRIKIDPRLPKALRGVRFNFVCRGNFVNIRVTRKYVDLFICRRSKLFHPVCFEIQGRWHQVPLYRRYRVRFSS